MIFFSYCLGGGWIACVVNTQSCQIDSCTRCPLVMCVNIGRGFRSKISPGVESSAHEFDQQELWEILTLAGPELFTVVTVSVICSCMRSAFACLCSPQTLALSRHLSLIAHGVTSLALSVLLQPKILEKWGSCTSRSRWAQRSWCCVLSLACYSVSSKQNEVDAGPCYSPLSAWVKHNISVSSHGTLKCT